jgi:hypothetical protein
MMFFGPNSSSSLRDLCGLGVSAVKWFSNPLTAETQRNAEVA